jgi:hypothetical protein
MTTKHKFTSRGINVHDFFSYITVMYKFCLAVVQSDGQLPGVAGPAPPVLSSNSVIVISDSEEEEKENRTAATGRPGRITSVTLMLGQSR